MADVFLIKESQLIENAVCAYYNPVMKTILFDLDGTLLPMVQDEFVNYYYRLLIRKLEPFNIDPELFIKALNAGAYAMVLNDGSQTNAEAFWIGYLKVMKVKHEGIEEAILDFYGHEFNQAIAATQPSPLAREIIDLGHQKGWRLILATSPLFPRIAVINRIKWAGLRESDFEYITSYENCHWCKPSLGYYQELCEGLNINPAEAMMIGNDPSEDMVAGQLGFTTYLVTDTLENRSGKWFEPDHQGSLAELYQFISQIEN